MSKEYEKGQGEKLEAVAPFWVYGAEDTTKIGKTPAYHFIAAFADRSDAEIYIAYMKKSPNWYRERLFKIVRS